MAAKLCQNQCERVKEIPSKLPYVHNLDLVGEQKLRENGSSGLEEWVSEKLHKFKNQSSYLERLGKVKSYLNRNYWQISRYTKYFGLLAFEPF